MGLSLICNDYHVGVGSYTGVHHRRKNWVLATIQYLKQWELDHKPDESKEDGLYEMILNSDNCKKLIKNLEEWCVGHAPFYLLNYTMIVEADLDLLRVFGLNGLYTFVNHSDSDGFLTPNESGDILETLSKIYLYLDEEDFDGDNKKLENYYLYNIFNKSLESGDLIVFC